MTDITEEDIDAMRERIARALLADAGDEARRESDELSTMGALDELSAARARIESLLDTDPVVAREVFPGPGEGGAPRVPVDLHERPYIQTCGGRFIDLMHPKADDISTLDIVTALGGIRRFNGHAGDYTVLDHSLHVHDIVKLWRPEAPPLWLGALLHDAHEAYLGDDSTPKQRAMQSDALTALRDGFDAAIAERYGMQSDWLHAWEVQRADRLALEAEAWAHLPGHGWLTEQPVELIVRRAEPDVVFMLKLREALDGVKRVTA